MGRVNLLVLRSANIERARDFYACFGFAFERHRHGAGPEHYAAEHAEGVLEIHPLSEGAQADTVGLGFAVPDLLATSALLRKAGFEPGDIAAQPWGTTFVVRDSDGRRVEVQQS